MADRPYRFGVLFVHGIGNQQRADTLLRSGGRLVRWIEGRARELSKLEGRGEYTVALDKASLMRRTPDDRTPAHVDLTMTWRSADGQHGQSATWLLAEAHWADAFPQPRFSELAWWSFLAAPVTVAAHFKGEPRPQGSQVVRWVRALVRFVLAVVAAALAILAFPVLLLVSALALLPIAGVRKFVVAVQRAIAQSVGDSFALVANPITAESIRGSITDDVLWMLEECDTIAVVAHSQGAALAEEILSSSPLDGLVGERITAVVTYGSGLKKLYPLRNAISEGPKTVWTLARSTVLAPVGGLLVFVAGAGLVALIDTAAGPDPFSEDGFFTLMGVILMGAIGSSLLVSYWKELARLAPSIEPRNRPLYASGVWCDLFSTRDIVPNGPLPEAVREHIEWAEVVNAHSRVFDHSGYWRSADDFVPRVVRSLSRAAGDGTAAWLPLWDFVESQATALRRRRRRTFSVAVITVMVISAAAAWILYDTGWTDEGTVHDVSIWVWGWWALLVVMILAMGALLVKRVEDLSLVAYQSDTIPASLDEKLMIRLGISRPYSPPGEHAANSKSLLRLFLEKKWAKLRRSPADTVEDHPLQLTVENHPLQLFAASPPTELPDEAKTAGPDQTAMISVGMVALAAFVALAYLANAEVTGTSVDPGDIFWAAVGVIVATALAVFHRIFSPPLPMHPTRQDIFQGRRLM